MSIYCIGLHKMSIYKITVICFFCMAAFEAIFSNTFTAHAHKRLFMNFRCKFRLRCSIRRPRFPIRVQNYSDLATFSVDFLHFICWISVVFLLPVYLTYWPRKFEDHTPIRSWVISYNVSRWLPLKMRTWPVIWGQKTITFLECPTPICLFTIQLLLGYDDD